MELHPLFGPSLPEKGWVPAPSFLLRRDRILRQMASWEPGALLEVGCGAGSLLFEFALRGYSCEALETSEPALRVARELSGTLVQFHREPQSDWQGRFDYLFAFEVLEHIEDDRRALAQWHSWLRPGGMMLISVPAHMRKWTASDIWAGHYRRYEQDDLAALITQTGFVIRHIETYGFPLANILSPLRARAHSRGLERRRREQADHREHNNQMSGVQRSLESRLYPFLTSLPGRWSMQMACFLQDLAAGRDWGTGYLVAARR